jgi:hypothetical protein
MWRPERGDFGQGCQQSANTSGSRATKRTRAGAGRTSGVSICRHAQISSPSRPIPTARPSDSTFEGNLDKKKFKACDSPRKVKRLDEGKHKFKVRAIDAAGYVDPSPAKDKFKVVD